MIPSILYHCTTTKKFARYRASNCIIPPVRGFSTLEAAQEFCRYTGRSIIVTVPTETCWKLPDHHNRFGTAWWNEESVAFSKLNIVQGKIQ